jgi:hypothetical protein
MPVSPPLGQDQHLHQGLDWRHDDGGSAHAWHGNTWWHTGWAAADGAERKDNTVQDWWQTGGRTTWQDQAADMTADMNGTGNNSWPGWDVQDTCTTDSWHNRA